MSTKSVAEKGRVRPGTTLAVVNPVDGVIKSLGLPPVERTDVADAQLVVLFAHDRAELESNMPSIVAALAPNATLWVFFRQGSKASGLEMNRDDVWAVAEATGMRPLGLLSVDETWSVFRLKGGA